MKNDLEMTCPTCEGHVTIRFDEGVVTDILRPCGCPLALRVVAVSERHPEGLELIEADDLQNSAWRHF